MHLFNLTLSHIYADAGIFFMHISFTDVQKTSLNTAISAETLYSRQPSLGDGKKTFHMAFNIELGHQEIGICLSRVE